MNLVIRWNLLALSGWTCWSEDNEVVADSLALLLDCYGHRATVAEDGESAFSLLSGRAFEHVLLDENLPEIKGSAVPHRTEARAVFYAGDSPTKPSHRKLYAPEARLSIEIRGFQQNRRAE
jgi:hypothetical protein